MKAFVLLATLWNPATGVADVFVLDHSMTGEDCVAVPVEVYEADAIEIEPGRALPPSAFVLSCEIDDA